MDVWKDGVRLSPSKQVPTDREIDTAMWLKNPNAFWLHPEGPLSDTTPEEWLAKQPPPEPERPNIRGVRMIHMLPGEKIRGPIV